MVNIRLNQILYEFLNSQCKLTETSYSKYLNLLITKINLEYFEPIDIIGKKDKRISISLGSDTEEVISALASKHNSNISEVISSIIFSQYSEINSDLKPRIATPNKDFNNHLWKHGKIRIMVDKWFDNLESISPIEIVLLARNLLELGEYTKAEKVINFALENPYNQEDFNIKSNLLLVRANIFRRQRKLKNAENLLYLILQMPEENTKIHNHTRIQLSVIKELHGEIDESIILAEDSLENFSSIDKKDKLKMYLRLSNLYSYKLDNFQTEKYYNKFLKVFNELKEYNKYSFASYKNRQAISLIRYQKYKEALKELNSIEGTIPDKSQESIFCLQNQAVCLYSLGQEKEALEKLNYIEKLNPKVSKATIIKDLINEKNIKSQSELFDKYVYILQKSLRMKEIHKSANLFPNCFYISIKKSVELNKPLLVL